MATVGSSLMNNDRLKIVVIVIWAQRALSLTICTGTQVPRHVKLKWELESIVDLESFPFIVVLGASQTEL